MYKLRLNAKDCVSCGICMDVCPPRAIEMRVNRSRKVEGDLLSYLLLRTNNGDKEKSPERMMTFPYMAHPHRCDGCMVCVNECPVLALKLQQDQQEAINVVG